MLDYMMETEVKQMAAIPPLCGNCKHWVAENVDWGRERFGLCISPAVAEAVRASPITTRANFGCVEFAITNDRL